MKEITIKGTYDDTVNASYYVLTHDRTIDKTIVVSKHCNVDVDVDGFPVGIEVL